MASYFSISKSMYLSVDIYDPIFIYLRKTDAPQSPQESLTCAGCMTSFKKVVPITSTNCWHVRCENCWQEVGIICFCLLCNFI